MKRHGIFHNTMAEFGSVVHFLLLFLFGNSAITQ